MKILTNDIWQFGNVKLCLILFVGVQFQVLMSVTQNEICFGRQSRRIKQLEVCVGICILLGYYPRTT